jgi:NADH:ubiquinone oxidoreductase subunit 2 (subunit N)
MSAPSALTSAVAVMAAILGLAVATYATSRAARPQEPGQGFGWMVIAGSGYLLLALAAAVAAPQGDGLEAAVVQAGTLVVAAALGALSFGQPSDGASSGRWLAAVALAAAWLTMLGLPPMVGFHARVLVYRSLLQAGWQGTVALALAISAAGLVPAFSALSLGCPGRLRGGRGAVAVLLLLALLAGGIYPGSAVSTAGRLLAALAVR